MRYTHTHNFHRSFTHMALKVLKIITALLLVGAGAVIIYIFRLQVPRHIVNFATVLGLAIGILLVAAGVFFPFVLKGIHALWQLKIGKIILGVICALFVAALAVFGATLGSIIAAQHNTAASQTTLIVLGCQVRGDTPSRMLNDRITAAYDYLSKHPQAVAVLSGGQGKDENISEAQCMYDVLTEKGIAPDRLYLEETSKDTDENIGNSLKIIQKNNLSKQVAVATSDFHQKRAAMICRRYGLEAGAVNAPTQAYLVPVYYTREVFAVVKESLL